MLDVSSKSVFRADGFEAGMATVADNSRVINPLQKELACYLSKFSIRPDNAYVRLFNKLRSCIGQISITTLNYDLLIEQSLASHGLNVDYNAENKGVSLLKPHGSSNFLPQIPNGMVFSGNTMSGCGSYFEGLKTKAASTAKEVQAWCDDPKNSDLSPVLAMYAKGKRVVVNRNLIQNTQQKYSELIASSRLVVLVGVKYISHDTHIWEPIVQARPNLLIVDPYPQDTIDWVTANNFDNVTVVDKSFDTSVWEITKSVHRCLYWS
ncbi:SIR2 family protein [Vreelandella aquamarina]|nr:SIR2 family protein [Halomonas meridiana]